MTPPKPEIDGKVRTAIADTRLLRLRYLDRERIVEPHDYGEHNGTVKLLVWQIGGASSGRLPNWRSFDVQKISEIEILDRTFPGGRPTASGQHQKWDRLYVRVKPSG
jgi:hypothetical protein